MPEPAEPFLISGYVLQGLIGTGSYGEVWKALAVVHRVECAIKIVRVAGTTDQRMVQRELDGLRRYSQVCMEHESLLKVLHSDALPDGGGFYYVMELADPVQADGVFRPRTLESELRARRRLPVPDTVHIGLELCSCIAALHRKGLVHADIKPSNVLYVGGRIKLGDIGLVDGSGDRMAGGGTVGYFPPESPGTSGSDLYALGKLLYTLVTGLDRTAFPTLPADCDRIEHPEQFAALNRVLTRACANAPGDRYPDIEAFATDLRQIEDAQSFKLRLSQQRLRRVQWALAATILLMPALALHTLRLRERNRMERLRVASLRVANGMQHAELGDPTMALPHFLAAMDADAGGSGVQGHSMRIGMAWAASPKLEALWHSAGGITKLHWDSNRARIAFGTRQGRAKFVAGPGTNPVEFEFGDPSAETSVALTEDGRFMAIATGNPGDVARIGVFETATRHPVGPVLELPTYVRRIEFSPDPHRLAIACDDGTVRVWDGWSGVTSPHLLRHNGQVRALKFARDGEHLLTAGWDGTARVWSHAAGTERFPHMRHDGYIRSAAYSPDFTRIATCGDDGYVKVWDSRSGQLVTPPIQVGARCLAITFSPDSEGVAVACFDGVARVFDARTGRLRGTPVSHRNAVRSVAFSNDGQWIGTASSDQTARLWEVATGSPVTPPMHHCGEVTSISFHTDRNRVFTTSEDGTVRCWWIGRDDWGRSHPFRPSDQRFAAISAEHRAVLSETGKHQLSVHPFDSLQALAGPFDTGTDVISAEFAPDARSCMVTTSGSELRIFPLSAPGSTPIVRRHATLPEDRLYGCFSPDGTRCATGGRDGYARIWDARDGSPVGVPLPHTWTVGQIRFSPSGRFLITGTADTYDASKTNHFEAVVWELGKFQRHQTLPQEAPVTVAKVDPREELVFTASLDRAAQLWSLRTGKPASAPLPHGGTIQNAEFSPDSRKVATAGNDNTVRIWNTKTGIQTGRSLRHSGSIRSLVFSHDGHRLYTGSDDRTVRIWDAESGDPISPPLPHASAVTSIVLASDESRLFTSSRTELLREWRLLEPERSIEAIRIDAQLMSSQRIDPDGVLQPITGADTWELWNRHRVSPRRNGRVP